MTKVITVCKAEQIIDSEPPIEEVTLLIAAQLPQTHTLDTLDDWFAFCDGQAQAVMDALRHLPQGVFDRVLAIMMGERAAKSGYKGTEMLD